MEDEVAKAISPETRAYFESLERLNLAKTKNIKPLIDALALVSKCRRSKGGGVCDPCWKTVTDALGALGVHIWSS